MRRIIEQRKNIEILDRVLQIVLIVVFLPFILICNSSNKVFQFLADFNKKCSEYLVDVVAYKIYISIMGLVIKKE